MKVQSTSLDGVYLLEPTVYEDDRGFFMESYNDKVLAEYGITCQFVQDNHSLSRKTGTLRGMHYQLEPYAQTKLVRVIRGSIFDVVIDLRPNSKTYGRWEGFELSAGNKRQLLVPRGFAHGFCTLEPNTEVLYKVDQYYSHPHDRGIRWDDPEIGIIWPVVSPILSEKDRQHPFLRDAEINFR
ncbi:dTDP-4-dehydrorhamnose 3,5-epimerase [Insulibacter thermoxylanivorax]|uniref:dTDP-4-dehydrorhamnose 3,5-epimerase n=1 Tax=Insulibacter thermoxylanivorax TaxID=2749268 RepID=A0A916QGS9_9BACL|nr:dTDP-4-dehydrorhamnose 3,5-epimerase [Insulibacter thermoxylanivorax]GFR39178.1 dTDP-4-dehydrorhamnose 3,5-epimerase [Insulibacter thermoxylanivorax]